MRDLRRSITIALLFVGLGLFGFPVSHASTAEEGPDAPLTLGQCRDQLLSGDFNVVDEKNQKPIAHVPRQLAKSVQDMIDREGTKDETKTHERFDRLHDDVMRKILEGRWGIDETSENILDDCYYSLHPEADPTD